MIPKLVSSSHRYSDSSRILGIDTSHGVQVGSNRIVPVCISHITTGRTLGILYNVQINRKVRRTNVQRSSSRLESSFGTEPDASGCNPFLLILVVIRVIKFLYKDTSRHRTSTQDVHIHTIRRASSERVVPGSETRASRTNRGAAVTTPDRPHTILGYHSWVKNTRDWMWTGRHDDCVVCRSGGGRARYWS